MANYSELWATTEEKLGHLLADVALQKLRHEEVSTFLVNREFGLALETLAAGMIEEELPVGKGLLFAIDELAASMRLRDEPFMHDLHNLYDRQHRLMS